MMGLYSLKYGSAACKSAFHKAIGLLVRYGWHLCYHILAWPRTSSASCSLPMYCGFKSQNHDSSAFQSKPQKVVQLFHVCFRSGYLHNYHSGCFINLESCSFHLCLTCVLSFRTPPFVSNTMPCWYYALWSGCFGLGFGCGCCQSIS